jgi:RNA 2',3'-cyclic 3'-phosphodiesterase
MGNHYFIAVPLPDPIKQDLSRLQAKLKENLTYKQWPVSEDFHITLKFFGDLPDNKVHQLKEHLPEIQKQLAFSINVGKIGFFGDSKRPRVLWSGVEKTESLQSLYSAVEEIASACGIVKENRPYRPHITIAKNWLGEAKGEQIEQLAHMHNEQQIMKVDRIVLYQIFPQQRPKYHPVATFELKGDGDTGSAD